MLAGLPNALGVYSPDISPELARERAEKMLENMVSAQYITEEQMEKNISGS